MANLMTKMIIMAFVIYAVLFSLGLLTSPASALYEFASNPTDWNISVLLSSLTGVAAAAGLAGFTVGTLFRNDLLTFGGAFLVLISFGFAFAELWRVVDVALGTEVAMIFVSPLILMYIFSCVAWWRTLEK